MALRDAFAFPRRKKIAWPAGSLEAKIVGLSRSLRRDLDLVCVNLDDGATRQSCTKLAELGLVVPYEEHVQGWPPMVRTRYRVETAVHMAWCAVCSKEEPGDPITEEP